MECSDSPVYIIGNTRVLENQTLTIDPGVEVKFFGNDILVIDGILVAEGTANNKITFSSADQQRRGSIVFTSPSDTVNLSHCVFTNLTGGQIFYDFENVTVEDVGTIELNDQGGATGEVIIVEDSPGNNVLSIKSNDTNTSITMNQTATVGDVCYVQFAIRFTKTEEYCSFFTYLEVNGGEWQQIGGIYPYNWVDADEWRQSRYDISSYVNFGDQIKVRFESTAYNSNYEFDELQARIDNVIVGSGGAITTLSSMNLQDVVLSKNNGHGIQSSSDISLTNSQISYSSVDGLNMIDEADVTLEGSSIMANGANGIKMHNGNLSVNNSYITHNGGLGIFAYPSVDLSYATVSNNGDIGIQIDNGTFSNIHGSIIYHNDVDNFIQISGSGIVNSTYSNIQGLSSYGIETNTTSSEFIIGAGNLEYDPVFADSTGTLSPNSLCIDAGPVYEVDQNMPPGLGSIQADIGAFGGPENQVWGGSPLPEGNPEIDHILDLPNDQGGSVGVQYTASIFDHSHTGYDITHYSFWRQLDVNGTFISGEVDPIISSSISNNRNDYWEELGTMSAQGFENYGYTAPTLSDSSSDGIFWSKYIVVAHTQEDDIYFVSEVDSGYSVDNIAPVAPEAFSTEFDSGILSTTWEDDINPDILHYEVFKDGDFFTQTIEKQFIDDGFDLGVTRTFKVRGVDVNDNVGEFSDPFLATYGLKGDITWDGIIDILDVTKIIYHILFPEEDITTEESWAGDYNEDSQIDVVDVTPVVDFILGGMLSELENLGGQTVALLSGAQLTLSSERPITGIQIKLSENTLVSNSTNLAMAYRENQIILYSADGQYIQGNNIPVLEFNNDVLIEDIIIVDNLGQRISAVLNVVDESMVPDEFKVHQNYPNPFNPATLVKVDVNKPINVMVSVYDVMGREISVLVNEQLHPGYHQFIWDGTDNRGIKAGSGLYLIMVQTPELTKTMKATLLR